MDRLLISRGEDIVLLHLRLHTWLAPCLIHSREGGGEGAVLFLPMFNINNQPPHTSLGELGRSSLIEVETLQHLVKDSPSLAWGNGVIIQVQD